MTHELGKEFKKRLQDGIDARIRGICGDQSGTFVATEVMSVRDLAQNLRWYMSLAFKPDDSSKRLMQYFTVGLDEVTARPDWKTEDGR